MAQMLPMIQIVPNMNLALDPVSGVIGASLGEGVILLSMDEINNEVTKLQGAADELVSSLDPYTRSLSWKGRFICYCWYVNKRSLWICLGYNYHIRSFTYFN